MKEEKRGNRAGGLTFGMEASILSLENDCNSIFLQRAITVLF